MHLNTFGIEINGSLYSKAAEIWGWTPSLSGLMLVEPASDLLWKEIADLRKMSSVTTMSPMSR